MDKLGPCEVIKDDTIVPDFLFKAIIIGDAGVGKSCILHRAVTNQFKDEYEVTIGAEFSSLIIKVQGKTVKLQVWDTAGQENFRSMIRVFYKGSHAAFLVYDLTKKETFEKLDDWIADVKENALPEVKVMLVGNRKDEEQNREVPMEVAKEFANKYQLVGFKETSAKTGEGVIDMFIEMAKMLYLDADIPEPNPKGKSKKSDKSGKKLKSAQKGKQDGCCQYCNVIHNDLLQCTSIIPQNSTKYQNNKQIWSKTKTQRKQRTYCKN
eukprot:TRINITY_DN112_c0_g1_i1.p7 TRINITY_DN112_c0_g1~~TRINITY_DN112_c0_g1_i1.p7  ORF type:complete len:266 (-),score=41.06 TRINITY_DN112_c0_g1_i1:2678-3475(-)